MITDEQIKFLRNEGDDDVCYVLDELEKERVENKAYVSSILVVNNERHALQATLAKTVAALISMKGCTYCNRHAKLARETLEEIGEWNSTT